jgi:cytochrome c-type biogenesis protein CcmH/NrfG
MLNHVDDIEFVHGAVMVHKKAAKRDISRTLDIADEYLRGRTPVAAEYERLGQFIMRHDGPCDRADAALQRASELGDESPDLLRNYAELRLRQNRFPEAAELAERRATLVGDAQTWNFAGNAHTCNGDHAAAARAYGRAACLQPGNPAYCRQLSEALERIGSLKEALAAARDKALRWQPAPATRRGCASAWTSFASRSASSVDHRNQTGRLDLSLLLQRWVFNLKFLRGATGILR